MAPLADAVGLVDHEKGRFRSAQCVHRVPVRELLGGDEQILELAVRESLERLGALRVGERRVRVRRVFTVLRESLDLVALQRDQWGHDDRRTVDKQRACPGNKSS